MRYCPARTVNGEPTHRPPWAVGRGGRRTRPAAGHEDGGGGGELVLRARGRQQHCSCRNRWPIEPPSSRIGRRQLSRRPDLATARAAPHWRPCPPPSSTYAARRRADCRSLTRSSRWAGRSLLRRLSPPGCRRDRRRRAPSSALVPASSSPSTSPAATRRGQIRTARTREAANKKEIKGNSSTCC
ncbi:hypothetical protein PVAP13_8KG352600 [Panicum virgatum]|uniref:Uncharacterized protein n=1 Tax=Panicum virgatum TaxID=38727 RepID=A0A8T0PSF6_PANVG|nr:hypothetical protein PVAP13_8KG352600 [Panicum virgatum]